MTGGAVMRIFFAMPLRPEDRVRVAALLETLRPVFGRARWVPSENLHLTLRFLGDRDVATVTQLIQWLCESWTPPISPLSLSPQGLGAFPSGARHTLFLRLQASDALLSLYASLEDALYQLGEPRERRRFQPHITLARDVALPGGIAPVASAHSVSGEPFALGRVTLFESVFHAGGVTYEPLAERIL